MMEAIDTKGTLSSDDIWSHFAGFLAELIARHAEELDIDSWPDPKKIIAFQELQVLYHRFMKFRRRKSDSNNDLSLEIPMDVCYSPHIQLSPYIQVEFSGRMHNDHQRANVQDHGRKANHTVQTVKDDRNLHKDHQ